MHIETVEVVHPDDPAQMMRINRVDLAGTHVLWSNRQEDGKLVQEVAKGPRGLWYVKRNGEIASKGFDSAQAALAEIANSAA